LSKNPAAAFQKALAGITGEVRQLFFIMCRKEGRRILDRKKKATVVPPRRDENLAEGWGKMYKTVPRHSAPCERALSHAGGAMMIKS
jgi:hypothetical protein